MAASNPAPIAVVGIGIRFPGGATDPEKLWTLLTEGHSCWTDVPSDRFNEAAFYHPNADASGTHNHRGGHFLTQDLAAFDAGFFQISPAEAQAMDPQQRVLLETTYDAYESCGNTLESIRGSNTAVYVARFSSDYNCNMYKDTDDIPKYHTTGTGEAILANRISYIFDLKGPSVTLDTGCSGSLVALHYACQSLRTGEVKAAIAGGINLILSPDHMIGMTNLHMLNEGGKSYSFDSRGSGYGRGEGSAIVILKTLADAIRCGDPIRGVICNTAVNQDGKTSGITFPSQNSQEKLQRSIYENAAMDPRTVGYVEAHGTGTFAGDLAEIGAIGAVFCNDRASPLYVGSIKSNVGHLESASGLAGLVKAILVLDKGRIPPNADFQVAKAELKMSDQNIIVPRKVEAFGDYPIRRASLNSFGYGGTNAHAILEQAPEIKLYIPDHEVKANLIMDEQDKPLPMEQVRPKLFILSARTKISLIAALQNLNEWTSTQGRARDLDDLAYTLSVRRSKLEWRYSFVAKYSSDIVDSTQELEIDAKLQRASQNLRVTYVFTGQGAQWYAMGRELILTCSQFRDSLSKSGSILQGLGASWNLIDELLLDESKSRVHQSWFAQPASTALQIALVDLLGSIGVQPQTVLGHSSGEIAAAYAGGILSQAAALQISYHRSFVSNYRDKRTSSTGAMLAVGLSEEEVEVYIDRLGCDDVCVACINSPISTTISGNDASIDLLHNEFQISSVFSRKLKVDTAYHSYHMQEASTQYLHQLSDLKWKSLTKSIRFISTVTASPKDSGFGPGYWVENLISKVRFSDAILKYVDLEQRFDSTSIGSVKQIVIEIGPHAALLGAIRQTVEASSSAFTFSYIPVIVRETNAIASFLGFAGKIFEWGIAVNFQMINSLTSTKSDPKVIHDLPTYPWDHSHRYWYESRLSKQHRFRGHGPHDLLGTRIASSTSLEPHWRHLISVESLPWLQEHIVDDLIVFPGAAYMCMAIEAARQLFMEPEQSEDFELELKNISFQRVLVIPQTPTKIELHLSLVKPMNTRGEHASSCREFRISAFSGGDTWNEHCEGLVVVHRPGQLAKGPEPYSTLPQGHCREKNLSASETDQKTEINPQDLYQELKSNGNYYGPCFAAVKEAYMYKRSRLSTRVEIPEVVQVMPAQHLRPHIIHPTTLDALMHSTLPLYTAHKGPGSVMPTRIDNFRISSTIDCNPYKQLYAETILRPNGPVTAKADIVVHGQHVSAEPVIRISAMEIRGFARNPTILSAPVEPRTTSYRLKWDVDPDFLSPSMFTSLKSAATAISHGAKTELLNRAALIYIDRSLAELKRRFANPCELHLQRLKDWMERHQVLAKNKYREHEAGMSGDDSLIEQVQHHGVEGQMLSRVGTALTSILTGSIKPLDLMLESDLLHKFYANDSSTQSYAHISQYLKHLCFKNPRMSILEIGAGTGSTTINVLRALSDAKQAAQMAHYDFTDISAGFFDKARDLLAEWRSLVTFKTLDISQDPGSQGFKTHSYDLIVASNVIHTTSNINNCLANIRSLLKPQGKLALIELTQPQIFSSLIFGILPGWWLGVNDGRRDSPLLTRDQWERTLSSGSFSGLDLAVDDFHGPAQASTFMVSSASTSVTDSLHRPIRIMADDDSSDVICQLASVIRSELELHGVEVSVVSWGSDHLMTDVIYMIIDCGRQPLLLNPTPTKFQQVVNLMTQCTDVFWISYQPDVGPNANPETALINGLARTAHAENQALRLVTLDIKHSADLEYQSGILSVVSSLLFRSFQSSSDDAILREREYIYENGKLFIPRIVADENVNRWISKNSGKPKADQMQITNFTPETVMDVYSQSRRPLKLNPSTAGSLDDLSFVDDHTTQKPLGDFDVEIDVKAHGVNPGNLAFACGQAQAHSVINECAGIITATGSKVTSLSVGHRVSALGMQPYASKARTNGNNAVRLPDSISCTVGASIPVAFMTAYYCLIDLADLKKGQNIVIFAATGSVEQAAIILAKHIGAVVLATVSNSEQRDFLVERFEMHPAHILIDDDESAWEDVLNATGRNEVSLILSRGPVALPDDTMAFGGNIIQVADRRSPSRDQMRAIPSDKNLTFRTVDLEGLIQHRPVEANSLFRKVMSLFETETIQPKHSITVKPITQLGDALKMLQASTQIGGNVLESGQDSMVSTMSKWQTPLALNEHASYIIAGGLGDVGRRLSELMVRRGARHIVILTRRKFDVHHYREVEDYLQLIAPQFKLYWRTCDISNDVLVRECATDLLSSGIPPIKGLVQAAIAMQDRTLAQMTLEDYNLPLQAKVHGTRNLYAAFEKLPLDFFVILSSIVGVIGTSGQASYAAGNTFQDAFAKSRPAGSFSCVSIDIGWIENAEYNNSKREQNLARHGLTPLRSNELLSLLEYAMSLHAAQDQDQSRQILTGFDAASLSQNEIANANTKSPMFCHIWQSLGEKSITSNSTAARSIRTVVSESLDIAAMHEAVAIAIAQKLARLVVIDGLQQKLDSPMAELGLDSLITTELKNWISTEFQAATQVSEILDRVSIRSLALLVASRSTFVQEKIESMSHDDGDELDVAPEMEKQLSTGVKATSSSNGLPALPLPELESTLSMYLESRKFFLSQKELAYTSERIAEFLQDGGYGRQLQGRLEARIRDPNIDNWLLEPYSNKIYLKRRDPIHPTGIFYGGHLLGKMLHTQAERAAVVAVAAHEFQQLLETGTVERDYMNGEPICMESLHWLFNAVREPRVGMDKMLRSPGHEYMIALRRGHIFRIPLKTGSNNVPYRRLKAAFEYVLANSVDEQRSVATLTADERDSWAKVREHVKLVDKVNTEVLSMIESAAFVVCLDDGKPSNASERCNQFFLGDPSNRWSDKNLQIVVCENGISAFVGEHAMLDGMSVRQFNRFITHAILDHKADEVAGEASLDGENLAQEIFFVTDPVIEIRISDIQQRFSEKYAPIEFAHHSVNILGSSFLRKHKCPYKAGYQVIIQLACLIYYGYQPESWETISMSHFHKGRVDWIQAIQPTMASFCAAARDTEVPIAQKRKMFFDAVNTFANTMTQIRRGHGFKAHMHALLAMVKDQEPIPALFEDQTWRDTAVSSIKTVKTDCLEGAMLQETAFLMAEPKCIFIHYEVEDDECKFFVQAWPGRTKVICEALETAAQTVEAILDSV